MGRRADLTMVHDEAKGFQDKVTRMREERVPGQLRAVQSGS